MNIFTTDSVESARRALEAGCGWIHCTDPDALDALIPPCRDADAILTLQGDVNKVMDTRVHGVILSPADMPPAEAREFLGPHAIIGVEVDSEQQILDLARLDLDIFVLTASAPEFDKTISSVREKGVEQRILSRFSDPAFLEAGADGLLTDDVNLL